MSRDSRIHYPSASSVPPVTARGTMAALPASLTVAATDPYPEPKLRA
jgi:hypothetical protein